MRTIQKIHKLLVEEGFKVDFATNDEHEREVTGYKRGTEEITILDNYEQAFRKEYQDFQTVKENVTAGGVYDKEIEAVAFECIKELTLQ